MSTAAPRAPARPATSTAKAHPLPARPAGPGGAAARPGPSPPVPPPSPPWHNAPGRFPEKKPAAPDRPPTPPPAPGDVAVRVRSPQVSSSSPPWHNESVRLTKRMPTLASLPVIQSPTADIGRKPEWLKVRAPGGPNYIRLKRLLREWNLHTVCEQARCPNVGECWEDSTATFMILGDVCTRNCGYSAIAHGKPAWEDREEPERIGNAVARLGLDYVVITSVNRDDLADGGAAHWAATIRAVRRHAPASRVQAVVPGVPGPAGLPD